MPSDKKTDLHHILKGVLWGVLAGETVTVLLLLLFALVMTLAGLPLAAADWLSAIAFCFGAFASGFFASMIVKQKGLLIGLICGVILTVIMFLIGTVFFEDRYILIFTVKSGGIYFIWYHRRHSRSKPQTTAHQILSGY